LTLWTHTHIQESMSSSESELSVSDSSLMARSN